MGVTRYLADKSALARLHLPAVREELEPLIMRALVGICGVTELEMLFSARNIQERSRVKEQLAASLDRVDTPQDIWDQAAEIQEALTEQAQHRSASIPDLIVAATARAHGLEILHYDRDFDTIARYTEQPARWIVPPGTVLPPPYGRSRPSRRAETRTWPHPRVRPSGAAVMREADSAGGGREPVGERDDKAAEFIRSLDDEGPVERREHRRQPVEPLRPQFDAEPALGLRIFACRGRGLRHARDAGRKPGADLLGCPLDPKGHLMPVRSVGEL